MSEKLIQGPIVNYDMYKVGTGLSRGANLGKKLLPAACYSTWPSPGATLDLDFSSDLGYIKGSGSQKSLDYATFTRASSAYYINQEGFLEQASINTPRFDWLKSSVVYNKNLLLYTEDFNNALWLKTNVTASTNTSGITTIQQVGSLTLVTSSVSQNVSLNPGQNTLSVLVKPLVCRYVRIVFGNFSSIINGITSFDLETLSVIEGTGTVSLVDDGYYKLVTTAEISDTDISGNIQIVLLEGPGDPVWSSTSTDTKLLVKELQLESGNIATEYLSTSVTTYSMPIEKNNYCSGLLVEESRINRVIWSRDLSRSPSRNMLIFSEDLDYWNNSNINWTTDVAQAPDSTQTADLVYPLTSGTSRYVYINYAPRTGLYTQSIYAKAAGINFLCFYNFAGSQGAAWFNLADGTIGTVSAGYSATIEDVGSGWYRCSISGLRNGVFFAVGPTNANSSTTVTANSTNGIYLWGAQLEFGEVVTEYEKTTSSLANWCKQNIAATKDYAGIDNVQDSACRIVALANNATITQSVVVGSTTTRTASFYLKNISGSGKVQVTIDGRSWSTIYISDIYWTRVILSANLADNVIGIRLINQGDSIALDCAQLEDGAFVTSPIITTNTTVTRAVDACTIFNTSNWYNGNYGTFICNLGLHYGSSGGHIPVEFNLSGSSNNSLQIFITDSSSSARVFSNSSLTAGLSRTVSNPKLDTKIAFSYSLNYFTSAYNSSILGEDTNTPVPNINRLDINKLNGYSVINRITYWPKRYTSSQLQEITR